MYGNNNCNCNPCNCNPCNRGGFFANYQAFWIIVVIAIVIIWVHYGANCWNGWGTAQWRPSSSIPLPFWC